MIKSISKLTLATILAAVVVGVPFGVSAQTASTNTPPPPMKHHASNYRGTLSAVDKAAKTITVETKSTKHTLQVTSETKIMKSGKPATLDDGVVGDPVSGSYTKDADGKLTAKSIYFGGKSAATATK